MKGRERDTGLTGVVGLSHTVGMIENPSKAGMRHVSRSHGSWHGGLVSIRYRRIVAASRSAAQLTVYALIVFDMNGGNSTHPGSALSVNTVIFDHQPCGITVWNLLELQKNWYLQRKKHT